MTAVKPLLRWLALLIVISFAMSILQWLAAPEGSGASGWGHALQQLGHPRVGRVLSWLSDVEPFRTISRFCERVINAPRNALLHELGYLQRTDTVYFYGGSHDLLTDDWRAILMFTIGTVVVYLPLVLAIALRPRRIKVRR